jgi:hypothetical protein
VLTDGNFEQWSNKFQSAVKRGNDSRLSMMRASSKQREGNREIGMGAKAELAAPFIGTETGGATSGEAAAGGR